MALAPGYRNRIDRKATTPPVSTARRPSARIDRKAPDSACVTRPADVTTSLCHLETWNVLQDRTATVAAHGIWSLTPPPSHRYRHPRTRGVREQTAKTSPRIATGPAAGRCADPVARTVGDHLHRFSVYLVQAAGAATTTRHVGRALLVGCPVPRGAACTVLLRRWFSRDVRTDAPPGSRPFGYVPTALSRRSKFARKFLQVSFLQGVLRPRSCQWALA